ncbi:hypothetical protein CTEN210_01433 [Chaetoceros tenuissimus]|uniref:AAA+ ATPase domain-containing protein n=1 Tax=Chaetoceros tenuissimus TaxID=426638 RepID=A0AAD3H034_9STRA|nr:hypothetical protein CTEN210_01433 [Chaetoceros tenuissimus]
MAKKKKKSSAVKSEKTQPEFSPALCNISKCAFVILALSGHFSANEYNDFLDRFDSDVHSDDDVDSVLNAMDNHEQDRMTLSKEIRTFVEAALNVISKDELDPVAFDILESSISLLSDRSSSYRACLAVQRKIILDIRQEVIGICSSNLELSMMAFILQQLSQQYLDLLHWESSSLSYIDEILTSGLLYSYLNSEKDKTLVANTVKDILSLSTGIRSCNKLDEKFWSNSKKNILELLFPDIALNSGDILESPTSMGEASKIQISTNENRSLETNAMRQAILQSESIQEAVNLFTGSTIFPLQKKDVPCLSEFNEMENVGATFVLLYGQEGTGKTYICDHIEKALKNNDTHLVIRPKIPFDFYGSSLGSFEDAITSLFTYIASMSKSIQKILLLLDDIDHLLFPTENSQIHKDVNQGQISERQGHLAFRSRDVFYSLMDTMQKNLERNDNFGNILVIATTRTSLESDRFNKTFQLGDPSHVERKEIISQCLRLDVKIMTEKVSKALSEIVLATVGRSRADIAQFCREAVEQTPTSESEETQLQRLTVFSEAIQSILPDSIKSSPNAGVIEMRVLSAKELRERVVLENGNEVLPLFGDNAFEAWKQLENMIVAPLCCQDELQSLLYGNATDGIQTRRKITNSGVLLCGDSGTGKTELAYHCASVAAGLNQSIRLLEVPCNTLIHKEVGGSERNVHKLFEAARAAAPCIIILDGIENIAPLRGNDNTTEGTMDRLLSTLLVEMDGVSSESDKEGGIAIIGITNNPTEWIDPALLRPGRLEKSLRLEKPSMAARREIFSKEIDGLEIDFSSSGFFDPKDLPQLIDAVVMRTADKSATEILSLCEAAKMKALHKIIYEGKDLDVSQKFNIQSSYFIPNL